MSNRMYRAQGASLTLAVNAFVRANGRRRCLVSRLPWYPQRCDAVPVVGWGVVRTARCVPCAC
jgi:hypothetical protein